MPILQIEEVVKDFGGLRALNHLTMAVKKGTITGLIGPNGAGKTTLFNAVTGFIPIDEGRILYQGKRIDGFPPHCLFNKGLMRTFQISRELQKMTVLDNLALVPSNQKGERFLASFLFPRFVKNQENKIRGKVDHILEFLGLDTLKYEYAANLSTGQKKLLELGRVMMADPELVLLDEPAAGVNPTLMKKLVEYIRLLNRGGKTFLVIEHDIDLVMNLCDPVIVLNVGQKLTEGPPEEVRKNPRVLEAYLGTGR